MERTATAVIDQLPKPDTNDRSTPDWFFKQCEVRYGPFDMDVAASEGNAKCKNYITASIDAFKTTWGNTNWCNCPYGPSGTIPKWIERARQQRYEWDSRTLLLLPADTSTRWYHDVSRTELIELVPFRLKFDSPGAVQNDSAKFGSLLLWIAPQIRLEGK